MVSGMKQIYPWGIPGLQAPLYLLFFSGVAHRICVVRKLKAYAVDEWLTHLEFCSVNENRRTNGPLSLIAVPTILLPIT